LPLLLLPPPPEDLVRAVQVALQAAAPAFGQAPEDLMLLVRAVKVVLQDCLPLQQQVRVQLLRVRLQVLRRQPRELI